VVIAEVLVRLLCVGYAQHDLIFLLRTVTDFIRCITFVNDKTARMMMWVNQLYTKL
jgi:hypothetical protein